MGINQEQQDSLERVADMLHRLEAVAHKTKGTPRGVHVAIARLHRMMWDEVSKHAEQLGIDVAPLSGGTPKPPRD